MTTNRSAPWAVPLLSLSSALACDHDLAVQRPHESLGAGGRPVAEATPARTESYGGAAGSAGSLDQPPEEDQGGASGAAGSSVGQTCGAFQCRRGEACHFGRCLDTCGAPQHLDALEQALSPGIEPLGAICRAPNIVDTAYDATYGQASAIEVTVEGSPASALITVQRWLIDPGIANPDPQTVGSHTVFSTDWVYPTAFASAAGSDSPILIGYTLGAQGYPGRVVVVGAEAASALDAAANHDVAVVGPDEWLLTTSESAGVASASLYWVRMSNSQLSSRLVAVGLGLFAGSVGLSADGQWAWVGAQSSSGQVLYALPLPSLRDISLGVGEPLDAATSTEVRRAEASSNFSVLSDGRLLMRSTLDGGGGLVVNVATLQVGIDGLSIAQHAVAASSELRGAYAAASNVLLQWDEALSLVTAGE